MIRSASEVVVRRRDLWYDDLVGIAVDKSLVDVLRLGFGVVRVDIACCRWGFGAWVGEEISVGQRLRRLDNEYHGFEV